MNDFQKIDNIENEISQYYKMVFDSDTDDYSYNKMLKNQLKEVIMNSRNNIITVEKALLVLAKSTGCAEDQEIAEDITDYLFENKIINTKELNLFYDNLGTNRWL
ncbi:hypothetical protein KO02_15165 [Sphingobacterium sp. ML3W]|uniref:hypothetical protein n=1 Tax=Sphingobacterium sp. ML3W TaxID=1538644 RepID=UPI0004F772B4|nr:hypothetical protein [Sphingobacterium sp. ML3W]AIM37877.1 hypothetical protein KO02_15165 [Sphingobacterium sp. ML3W]